MRWEARRPRAGGEESAILSFLSSAIHVLDAAQRITVQVSAPKGLQSRNGRKGNSGNREANVGRVKGKNVLCNCFLLNVVS